MPERSPAITPTCLKCGSDAMIPDVRVIEQTEDGRAATELGLATKPDAVVFKGEVRVQTRAVVCGDCGFIELYAADPAELWDAHIDRLSRDL